MEIGIVKQITVEEEMRNSYLDYAMSVIISRALPDVRDGLKPSQRRILVAMHDLNLSPGRPYRKCAKIAGDTSGNYHPHGEAVIYPTLVRLAQTFNMRYPLADGQGNFGSVDGDPPAAMRYTEARMTALAVEMLADIDKDTVDWTPNYDGTRNEPTVLPGRFPNLICNGSAGIAVGMATNIPPHNLNEVVGALVMLIDNPEATVDDLCKHITGPDFPTGGLLITKEKDPKTGQTIDNLKTAYASGRGRVVIRARTIVEERKAGFFQIVVTELPYQVNKATLQEKIAELVRERRVEGVSDMRDESDRQGMRLVIELKREASPRTVLNQLYKYTAMQSSFGINMLALVIEKDEQGNALPPQPRVLSLKRMLQYFLDYRHEVLTRRTRFELEKARARAHILEGLKIALDNLDAVIRTIRESASAEAALVTLQERFTLSEIQARAILDMQLRRLAALERQQILDEYKAVMENIAYLEDLLAHPHKILLLVRDELLDLKKKYGDARRTEVAAIIGGDLSEEDLIPNDEVLVTISGRGYVKRLRSDTYRVQRRGGRGIKGQVLREEDALRHMVVANARDNILFFTNQGKVYQTKAYQIPEFERTAKGIPLINVIDLDPKESVTAVLAAPDFENNQFLLMATLQGEVKKVALKHFETVRRNGLKAMDIEPNDELCWVRHCRAGSDVILVSEQGQALRFVVDENLRESGRGSGGVRGLKLAPGDNLAGMDVVDPDGQLLVVTEHGMGKRTRLKHYSTHGRGTGGQRILNITKKTGKVASVQVVHGDEELMMISASGIVIRTELSTINQLGPYAQGVIVMNLRENDRVACIAVIDNTQSENGKADAAPEDLAATTPRASRPRKPGEGSDGKA
ncbi:MAG: DNA gyrase subunit A [Chloroflexi bacterium]|nr:DNA gyrase subunit A [Chloroflexota bacterium]